MVSKKTSTAKKRTATEPGAEYLGNTRLKKGDWLILPLGILAALCVSQIVMSWQGLLSLVPGSPAGFFYHPPFIAFLIIIFSAIYIYKIVRRLPRHIVAKVAAYALSFTIILIGIAMAFYAGSDYYQFFILFFNPLVSPFMLVITIGGIVASLLPSKKR
ncbi:hypothetical protein ACIBBE_11590 [Streptomyces sp. NPDC051644]|uniref:hypothetical protein n=1 Tax=Streptomyces sp. NPDC051644 TaxID=3365666 RepID=UPI0037B37A4C